MLGLPPSFASRYTFASPLRRLLAVLADKGTRTSGREALQLGGCEHGAVAYLYRGQLTSPDECVGIRWLDVERGNAGVERHQERGKLGRRLRITWSLCGAGQQV